jgi:protein arginine kinase activator
MKCDRCSGPATIHEVVISSGQRSERHLCEACAADTQLAPEAPTPLTDLLAQYLSLPDAAAGAALSMVPGSHLGPSPASPSKARPQQPSCCGSCGLTFAQFRKDEKLGCGHCYHTFFPQLQGLVQRLHDGATAHIGKVPRRLISGEPPRVTGIHDATRLVAALPNQEIQKAHQAKLAEEVRAQLAARLRTLQEALQQAVQCEQYERAAELRDQIRHLEALAKPAGGATSSSDHVLPPDSAR